MGLSTSVRTNQRIVLDEKCLSSKPQSELFYTRQKSPEAKLTATCHKPAESETAAGEFSGGTPAAKVGTTVLKPDCWTLPHMLATYPQLLFQK